MGESRVESQEGGSFYSGTETGGTQMGLKDGKGCCLISVKKQITSKYTACVHLLFFN